MDGGKVTSLEKGEKFQGIVKDRGGTGYSNVSRSCSLSHPRTVGPLGARQRVVSRLAEGERTRCKRTGKRWRGSICGDESRRRRLIAVLRPHLACLDAGKANYSWLDC